MEFPKKNVMGRVSNRAPLGFPSVRFGLREILGPFRRCFASIRPKGNAESGTAATNRTGSPQIHQLKRQLAGGGLGNRTKAELPALSIGFGHACSSSTLPLW